jgi:DNA repair exonuclease SbcCD ATPase subunit
MTVTRLGDDALLADLARMNRIQLIRLALTNFKGCREFTLEASGRDLAIFGDNATGKTTVADAFFWLLFGKDSHGSADFEIKTLGEDGEPIHNLEHSVEALLGLPDGKTLELRRVYKERWTKTRGSATAEFSGHTTEYFVNGVPVQEKDFRAQVADILDEKRFRLLTDPLAFNSLHWQERRKLLLEICGDVSDEDVIAANNSLSELSAILDGRSIDDYRKILAAKRREINDELRLLPAKISALRDALPDESPIRDDSPLRAELQRLQEERARITAGGHVAEMTKRQRELEAQMIDIEIEIRKSVNADRERAEAALAEKRQEFALADAEVKRLESLIASKRTSLSALDTQIQSLREVGKQLQSLSFEFTGNSTCAACGQQLPADRVAQAREKALAEFQLERARKLEANIAEGKALRKQLDELTREVAELESDLERVSARAESLRREGIALKKAAEATEVAEIDPSANARYEGMRIAREKLIADIDQLRNGNADTLAALDQCISTVEADLREIANAQARNDARKASLEKIAEYESQEKMLAQEFETLERHAYLCDEFVRVKVSLLTERINSRFKLARFKLFEQQVNGAINEICETTYDGVPFGSLNHGARLNVGLDIINTLSEHYQFAPPIFIDNAESVTSIIPTAGQQIKLIVSAIDKRLRVESAA